MKNWHIIIICFCLMLLMGAGCGTTSVPGMVLNEKHKQKTQLEIREMQTRIYETTDTKMLMKAMLNVLQDDNFIIKQVNIDLGFFNATKESDVEDGAEKFWQTFWWGKAYATYKKNSIIDCTSNVSEFGNRMRVRANFQIKIMDNKGGCVLVQEIDDPEYYQGFFSKVDKGIFIEDSLYTSESKNNNKVESPILEKNIVETNIKEDNTPLKKCDKCGRDIGKDEKVCFFNTLLVCPDCFKRLSKK